MNLDDILKKINPILYLSKEHQDNERRIYSISQLVGIDESEVRKFAKTHPISLRDTMEFAARYGRLPNDKEAWYIFEHGIGIYNRLYRIYKDGFM